MIGSIIPSKTDISVEKYRLNTTLQIMSHPTVSTCTAFKCVNHVLLSHHLNISFQKQIIAQAIFLLFYFFFTKADCSTRKLEHILEFVIQHQKYQKYIENDTVTLRFFCDGAKIAKHIKHISSVRGVFKILAPRQSLPDNIENLKHVSRR